MKLDKYRKYYYKYLVNNREWHLIILGKFKKDKM